MRRLWIGLLLSACGGETVISSPNPGNPNPTNPQPCFELESSLMDMGVFEVGEVPDPITVHLQSRCPPNHPEIQFDDPDNMFDISEPYRLQNQWYFDLSIDPVSAGSWEAQVLINDISLIELITLQVFATVIEEDD